MHDPILQMRFRVKSLFKIQIPSTRCTPVMFFFLSEPRTIILREKFRNTEIFFIKETVEINDACPFIATAVIDLHCSCLLTRPEQFSTFRLRWSVEVCKWDKVGEKEMRNKRARQKRPIRFSLLFSSFIFQLLKKEKDNK